MIRRFAFVCSIILTGCVNGFVENYSDVTTISSRETLLPYSGITEIIRSSDLDSDAKTLFHRGYDVIGKTHFRERSKSREIELMEQAKVVGADMVLWATANAGYETMYVDLPKYVPGTTSTTTTEISGNNSVMSPKGGIYTGQSNATAVSTTTTSGTTVTDKIPVPVRITEQGALFFRKTKSTSPPLPLIK